MRTARSIQPVTIKDRTMWDRLAGHPLQSWAWGEFRRVTGVDVERLGVYKNAELVAGWQITFHHIPLTPWTIGYFPKGPQPSPQMIHALSTLGRQKKAIFIQLEPNTTAPVTLLPPSKSILTSLHTERSGGRQSRREPARQTYGTNSLKSSFLV